MKNKITYILEKIKRLKVNIIFDILKLIVIVPISFLCSIKLKKKKIWIIEENPIEANDNGYALLKYIKKHKKDINVYYVIDKKSKKINEVKNVSNIIVDKSIEHWIYYFNAKVIAVTQKYANPSPAIFYVLHNLKLIKGKRVFLQHGIIKDDIRCYHFDVCKFDLFICGAKKEYEFVKESFGYPINNVKYTGLARFDNYSNYNKKNIKRFILIAPTWRNWIKNKKQEYDYFDKWNELINDEIFQNFLKKNEIEVKFVLHQEMNEFKEKIKNKNEKIKIYKSFEVNYNEIIKQCLLLITDFSSIFFDVAYLKKPIIYYQFDEKKYRNKHLQDGYFSYLNDGFGDICYNKNNVINKIINYNKLNFKVEEKYLKRIEEFFERRDSSNCQRITEEILKLIN